VAIIKSGAVSNPPEGHRSIEISFDGEGRPAHPGCLLSISHTETIAVAICFWLGELAWPAPAAAPATGVEAARPKIRKYSLKTRIFAFLVLCRCCSLRIGALKVLEFYPLNFAERSALVAERPNARFETRELPVRLFTR